VSPQEWASPLLYYITDRQQFAGDERQKREKLLQKIAECAAAGADYVQLREKDLSARNLERLTRDARATIPTGSKTRLLINGRTDIALACGAHGVHLPVGSISASEVRSVWMKASRDAASPVIGVSAHSLPEVMSAEAHGADFVVFGPVFQKEARVNAAGLEQLQAVCRQTTIPVLALGGVTLENARQCLQAGAAGVAGIRLFQAADAEICNRLRSSTANP
jgi:thiamine-phosphate pyrophosphorylase